MPKINKLHLNSAGLISVFPLIIIAVVMTIAGWLIFQQFSKTSTPTQPTKTVRKIGIIQNNRILQAYVDGLKLGLKELGYEEGKDVVFDLQNAQSDVSIGTEIAKKFVEDNVDVIYAITAQAIPAIREATASGKSIPVVIMGIDRPDQRGFVKSLKSSGNHVTGVANNHQEYVARRLEILKQLNPNAKKIGVFGEGFITQGAGPFVFAELKKQAPNFEMTIVEYKVEGKPSAEIAEKEARKRGESIKPGEIDVIFHIPNHVFVFQDELENMVAKRLRIPAISGNIAEVEGGGLYTYVSDFIDDGKQAAVIVDKIFKGTKPTDIPIEFPKKPLFVVNFKTAKEIGITFPPTLLELIHKKIE